MVVLAPSAFPAPLVLAICARFALNLAISIFSSFSFLFVAPGLLFRLFLWIFACPTTTSPFSSSSSFPRPGSASASDSRFATSFLFGRRRFWTLGAFSILLTKEECFIANLSFFDEAKRDDVSSGAESVI